MYVIREIMYCKPGKVRALVEKFLAMNEVSTRMGMPTMRVMTDFSADRYWTLVAEMEVETLEAFEKVMAGMSAPGTDAGMKEMEKAMEGYHELVDYGKREIYKLESK